LATSIIDSLSTDWKPERYRDTYTDDVRQLLSDRAAGKTVEPEPAAEGGAAVLDLMKALEASVADAKTARSRKGRSTGRSTGRRKTTRRAKTSA
jgi:DNA end-binding protein Ku